MSEFQIPEAKKAEVESLNSQIEEADDVLYSTVPPEDREGLPQEEVEKIEAIRETATAKIEKAYARLYELTESNKEEVMTLIDKFLSHRSNGYTEIAEELGFSVEEIADLIVSEIFARVPDLDSSEYTESVANLIRNNYPGLVPEEEQEEREE